MLKIEGSTLRRMAAMVLIFILTLSLLPLSAFANDEDEHSLEEALAVLEGEETALSDEVVLTEDAVAPLEAQSSEFDEGLEGDDELMTAATGTCVFSLKSGILTIQPKDGVSGQLGAMPTNLKGSSAIESILVDDGVIAPENMQGYFKGLSRCTFMNLESLDTSNTTNMGSMFEDCSSLTRIYGLKFDTRKVTNFHDMFAGCRSISTLDLSTFTMNLSDGDWQNNATARTRGMFADCTSLTQVKVGNGFKFAAIPAQSSGLPVASNFKYWDQLPFDEWKSSATGAKLTSLKIAQDRSGIADTYTYLCPLRITKGANKVWYDFDGGFSITSSAPISEFQRVQVDSKTLGSSDYWTTDEATTVWFSTDYLKKLPSGRHTVDIVSSYGTASTFFTVMHRSDYKVMYRLYNPNSGEHFYTADAHERDSIVNAGWKYEGTAWTAPTRSNTPVYRLYSGTDHHYTTDIAERNMLTRAGWEYEGIGWYSDDAKGVPLYRQFNPNVNPSAPRNNAGSHNYTTSKSEERFLVSVGWKAEGIGWYGLNI